MRQGLDGFRVSAGHSAARAFCLSLLAVATAFAAAAPPAQAGCGCDHPPPLRGSVYPRFAWSGSLINVYAEGETCPQPCVQIKDQKLPGMVGRQPPSGLTGFCATGQPQVLTMAYTGAGCQTSHNSQGQVDQCQGNAVVQQVPPGTPAPFISLVHIVAYDANNKNNVWFNGLVNLNGTFNIDANNANRQLIGASTVVTISDPSKPQQGPLQTITLGTNCAVPLNLSDTFGALTLQGFTAGTSFCDAGLMPQVLTMAYTGAGCQTSYNSQGQVDQCQGNPVVQQVPAGTLAPFISPVHIVARQANGPNNVWFDGLVNLNGTFNIDAKNAERLQLIGATTVVTISDPSKPQQGPLQTITLGTNCAVPLNLSDTFGALTLQGFTADPTPPDETEVVVPDIDFGPQAVTVFDTSCKLLNDKTVPIAADTGANFTVIPRPVPILEMQGSVYYHVPAAVAADGTLLIAFDLTRVNRAMQFFVVFNGLPLRFGVDDVVYYNKDQYNLELFTRSEASPDEYLWGRYYGLTVDGATNPGQYSDLLGYWRHEFNTYRVAHLPGGPFAVSPAGKHPDGTTHIDHYYLVASINGQVANHEQPSNQTLWTPLQPGKIDNLNVIVLQLFTDGPVAFSALTPAQLQTLQNNNFQVQTDHYNMVQQVQALGLENALNKWPDATARRTRS